jgi:hypothetical protein
MALNDGPEKAPAVGHGGSAASYAPWLAPAWVLGLLFVFLGERVVLGGDAARYALSGVGLAAVLGATVLRFAVAARADGERRGVERSLALFFALGLAGLVLYFATGTDLGKSILHIAQAAPDKRARIETASTIAWALLVGVSVVPLLFGERALAPMRTAQHVEARRVRSATQAGLTLALAAAYVALFTYAAGELDVKADFSYFRTSRPSESTKNVARNLTEPVKAIAFFPKLNDVGVEVEGYLRELGRAAPGALQVEVLDRLMMPALAKEAKVTQDGVVVLQRGGSRETVVIGADIKSAGAKLKALDQDFQKALLKVLREQRVAYLTVGHGELVEASGSDPEGRAAKTFRKLLESQNYVVKELGVGQGLGGDVPSDAFLVAVLGPSKPFLPEEVAAVKRFADRGGKLFLALDPDGKADLAPLAATVDLTWQPTALATDDPRHIVARRHDASDRANLASNRFSSHASVTTLSRNSSRAFVVLPGASPIDRKDPTDAKIDFTIKTFPETFVDLLGNFVFDEGSDKRGTWNVAAAVTKPASGGGADKGKPSELRAFVLADADGVADYLMSYDANFVLALDAVRWLGGEESFAGAVTTAEDVRIEHTKQKDVLWFYGTIFGAPALVLGLGLYTTRRKARTTERRKA